MSDLTILAGDIGGTKTNLALFKQRNAQWVVISEATYSSKEYSNLEQIIQTFLLPVKSKCDAACFGVAGPVVEERCQVSNLPWVITVANLRELLQCKDVNLINDLEAIGYSIPLLSTSELVSLNPQAKARPGNAALIAAGTGLGEALLYWDGQILRPSASEGGNTDFAPRNATQIELLRYLLQRSAHVSYEQVVSGPGLYNIYQFLRDTKRGEEPHWLWERLHTEDPSAVIAEVALAKRNDLCVQALDIFVSVYGAEAGNIALKFMGIAGIYIGGGIAPKIIEKLQEGTFMRSFTDKGQFARLTESIPVQVILNPKAGLLGAARRANLGKN